MKSVALRELGLNGSVENRGQRTYMVNVFSLCFLFFSFKFWEQQEVKRNFFSVSFTFSSKFPYVLPSFFFLSSPFPLLSFSPFSPFHSYFRDNSTISSVIDGLGVGETVGM